MAMAMVFFAPFGILIYENSEQIQKGKLWFSCVSRVSLFLFVLGTGFGRGIVGDPLIYI
jgi:hypothetical protein